jgi:hypothetical protein
MEVGWGVEVEVAHRTLSIALVERSWLFTIEAPVHDVT